MTLRLLVSVGLLLVTHGALVANEKSVLLEFEVAKLPTWVASTDPCENVWEGIICNEFNNSVVEIALENKRLTVLPASVSTLNSLQKFTCSGNTFASIPTEIGNLSFLRRLWLSDNGLSSVPTEIGRLFSLRSLSLSGNKLTTIPTEITEMTGLEEFFAFNNQLPSLPPTFTNLINLKIVSVYSNKLTALPDDIGKLSKLTELVISDNKFTALPTSIGQLTSLTRLTLFNNLFTALPPEIGNLVLLSSLLVSRNKLQSVPAELGQLTALTTLFLNFNSLTSLPSELGTLTSLRTLQVSDNAITTLPDAIAQLTSLEKLQASNNKLTSLPATLAALPRLQILEVDSNQLTSVPNSFSNTTALVSFDVNANPFPCPFPPEWFKFPLVTKCVEKELTQVQRTPAPGSGATPTPTRPIPNAVPVYNLYSTGTANNYGEHFEFNCRNGLVWTGVSSTFDMGLLDRSFEFTCSDIDARFTQCLWNEVYQNDYTVDVNYNCTGFRFLTGISMRFSLNFRDRKVKFQCCETKNTLLSNCLRSPATKLQTAFAWQTPENMVMRGAQLAYSPSNSDRQWSFVYCVLKVFTPTPVLPEATSTPAPIVVVDNSTTDTSNGTAALSPPRECRDLYNGCDPFATDCMPFSSVCRGTALEEEEERALGAASSMRSPSILSLLAAVSLAVCAWA